MDYFKNDNGELGNFIQNSRTKIENSLNRMDSKTFRQKSCNLLPDLVRKIVNNLDMLTKEEKIIWSKDKMSLLRGIVIEDCLFSGYKIIIEKWDMPNINEKKIAGFNRVKENEATHKQQYPSKQSGNTLFNGKLNLCHSFSFLQKYKISFVKGILNAERIEYITNLEENYDELSCLFGTIEIKLSQQKN